MSGILHSACPPRGSVNRPKTVLMSSFYLLPQGGFLTLTILCQGYPALVILHLLLPVAGGQKTGRVPKPAVWLEASPVSPSPGSLSAVWLCVVVTRVVTYSYGYSYAEIHNHTWLSGYDSRDSSKALEQSQEQTLPRKRGFLRVAGAR